MSGAGISVLLPAGLAASAVFVYLAARARGTAPPRGAAPWAMVFLLLAFVLLLLRPPGAPSLRDGAPIQLGGVHPGTVVGLLAAGIGFLACLFARDGVDRRGGSHLFHPLLLLSLAGAAGAALARDLFTAFVMVELSAIPSYALVAWSRREDPGAVPAALKYLLQGVAGTVTALAGLAFLYLQAGTLDIERLPAALHGAEAVPVALGAALILGGYGVKLAVVPLHTWLPDAYVHAPAPVTAVMAGATKTGVLVALFLSLSVLPVGEGGGAALPAVLGGLLCAFAVATMTTGNLLALGQRDLRRTLAYSSVAQMGYALLGFGIGLRWGVAEGFRAGLFYAVAHAVMKSGAFLGADLLAARAGTADLPSMRGAGARSPLLGAAFAVMLLGLVGVPATVGFPGKLLLLRSGMEAGGAAGIVLALALAGNTLLSLGYYAPALSTLLFRGEGAAGGPPAAPVPAGALAAVLVLAAATGRLGGFPAAVDSWIQISSHTLVPGGAP